MSNIIRISEAASIALHAMVFLASQSERIVPSKEMASILGRSEAHLSKVLQRLAKAGLVSSTRGPRGGFVLKRPARDVSLLEVYEAIEGPLEETKCLLGQPICRGEKCIFGDLLNKVDQEAKEYLSRKRLSDLGRVLKQKHN
jgi:Rrf2 family protein